MTIFKKYILFLYLCSSFFSIETHAITAYDDKKNETDFLSMLDSSRFYENMDFKKSLKFVELANRYADSLNVPSFQIKSLIQYGRIYLKIGLMDLSSDYYLKSLAKLEQEKVKVHSDIIDAQIGLGGVYLFLGEFDNSQKLFEETLHLLDSLALKDYLSYSSVYNNLGIIHKEKEELIEAYYILEKGVKLLLEFEPDNKNLPLLYNNLGDVYLKMKNYIEALASYERSLSIRIQKNDILGIAATYKNIGILYHQKKELKSAVYFLRKAFELGESIESVGIQNIAADQLADIYKQINQTDSSLFFLEVKNHTESLLNIEKASRHLFAEEIKRNYQQQYEVLNKQGQQKARNYLYILTLLGLALIVIVYFFIVIRKKYSNLSLEMINAQLIAEKIELEEKSLRLQLEGKDKKLIANLLYSIKRNQLVKDAVGKLMIHRKNFSKDGQEVVRGVLHDLNNSQEENVFEEFEVSFLNLHEGFYQSLLKEFPNLSLNEKRICAFIRLNLTTKEIALITGQELSALHKAKVRLRKKLGLTHSEQDLYDFLAQF